MPSLEHGFNNNSSTHQERERKGDAMRRIYRGILYERLLTASLRATIGIYARVRSLYQRER